MKTSKLLASLLVSIGLITAVHTANAQNRSMADESVSLVRSNTKTVSAYQDRDIQSGLPRELNAQIRDFIVKKFGTGEVSSVGDYTQRTIYQVLYLGKNRQQRKYNDNSYYSFHISTSVVVRGARGEYRGKSTSYSIDFDVIMKNNTNEILEYKWMSKAR
jgi:hypothetical protein